MKNLKGYDLLRQAIPLQVFERLSSTNLTSSILEYFVPNILHAKIFPLLLQEAKNKALERNWLQKYISICNTLKDCQVVLLIGFILRAIKIMNFIYLFILTLICMVHKALKCFYFYKIPDWGHFGPIG